MAREIKFRAWSKVEEEMVYGIDLTTQDGTAHPINGNWDNIMSLDERVELMQYTGLTDKAGVEIYEGDVVRAKSPYWRKAARSHILQVIWLEHGAWHPDGGYTMEVIGNIWENPELLKNNGEDTK